MDILLSLMIIFILIIISQWLAWLIRLPAILFLLISGILIGPISSILLPSTNGGIINPSHLFGEHLLHAGISISVAIILFEGCMNLNIKKIDKDSRKIILLLITLGFASTVFLTALISHFILELPWSISLLLAVIISVSGPTVVGPILNSIRPPEKLRNIINCEGMLIDPIGAVGAVIVYTAILNWQQGSIFNTIYLSFLIAFVGSLLGFIFGYLVIQIFRRDLIAEHLSNLLVLCLLVIAFIVSETLAEGAGLWCIAIMGLVISNIGDIHLEEVINFKEHLSIFLISFLFIILGANIQFENIDSIILPAIIAIMLLQLVVRPISVFLCSIGSALTFRQRLLLSWIYPRGIVVASIAALFSIRVSNQLDMPEYANQLALFSYLVLIGTVFIQSLTAPYLANRLKVKAPDANIFLIIGANILAQKVAIFLKSIGYEVIMADYTSRINVYKARLKGINCYYGDPATKHADKYINSFQIGWLLGLSHSDHINTLSAIKYYSNLPKKRLLILPSLNEKYKMSSINKRYCKRLFSKKYIYSELNNRIKRGAKIKMTKITEQFTWQNYLDKYCPEIVFLFLVDHNNKPHFISPESALNQHRDLKVSNGWHIVSLIG